MSLAALGTSAAVRDVERQLEQLLAARKPILILGEPGTGHDVAARALHAPDTPRVALAGGARLAANPLAVLEEARDGTLYCAEIGQYAKAEQRGLAFLLPKLDKANVTLVCTSAEPLGNLAAEGKFDAALLSALSAGAVLLPPLRARREDIPALIERFWHEVAAQERNAQQAAARASRRCSRRRSPCSPAPTGPAISIICRASSPISRSSPAPATSRPST